MFAVIKTGGKQYRVTADQVITVEKLIGDAGATVEFDEVLAVGDGDSRTIGAPHVEGAGVRGAIVEHKRGDKIVIFKKKRRKNYRRKIRAGRRAASRLPEAALVAPAALGSGRGAVARRPRPGVPLRPAGGGPGPRPVALFRLPVVVRAHAGLPARIAAA